MITMRGRLHCDFFGDGGGFDPVAQVQKNDRGVLDREYPDDFLGVGTGGFVTGLKRP